MEIKYKPGIIAHTDYRLILSLLIALNLNLVVSPLFSQVPADQSFTRERDSLDAVYGSDPTIFNGQIYVNPNPGARGTPFLGDYNFLSGEADIRGQHFENLMVRYDIFGQRLILQNKNLYGGLQNIALSDAWIKGFSIGSMYFERFDFPDGQKKILQIFGDGNYRVGVYYSKELLFNSTNSNPGYYYSPEKKTNYLLINGSFFLFRNNRTFLHLFPRNDQAEISKYLSVNKVDLKKGIEKDITGLINFCNTLK